MGDFSEIPFADTDTQPDFNAIGFDILDVKQSPNFADQEAASEQQQFSALEKITYGAGGIATGALDTVINSVPFVDADENTIRKLTKFIGEDFDSFFKQHRDGLTAIGDVVTTVPLIGYATKAIQTGSFLEKVISKTATGKKYGKFIFADAATLDTRVAALAQKQTALLKAGERNFERNPEFVAEKAKIARNYATDLLKQTVAGDVAFITFQNDSKFFFPEEMDASTAALFFAIPDAIIVGTGFGIARSVIKRRLVQEAPSIIARSQAGEAISTVESLSRKGERDIQAMVQGKNVQNAEAEAAGFAKATDDETAQIGVQVQLGVARQAKLEIDNIVEKIATDNIYPYLDNAAFPLSKGAVITARDNVIADPAIFNGVVGIVPAGKETAASITRGRLQRIEALEFDLRETEKSLGVFAESAKAKTSKTDKSRIANLQNKREKLFADIREQKNLTAQVMEIDGGITPLSQRFFSLADTPDKIKWTDDLEPDSFNFATSLTTTEGKQTTLSFLEDGSLMLAPFKETKSFIETVKKKATGGQITQKQADSLTKEFFAKQLNSLDAAVRPVVWAGAQRQLGIWEKRVAEDATFKLTLSPKQHYITLDMISEFAKKYPDNVLIKGGEGGFADFKAVEFESLSQKFKQIMGLFEGKSLAKAKQDLTLGKDVNEFNNHSLARSFNLPSGDAGIPAPLMEIIRELVDTGAAAGKKEVVSDLKTFIKDMDALEKNLNQLTNSDELILGSIGKPVPVATRGSMIEIGRNEKKKPAITLHKGDPNNRISHQVLTNMQTQLHFKSMSTLLEAEQKGALLVAAASQPIFASREATKIAASVKNLLEGTLQGKGVTSTQGFKNRGVPELEAMDLLIKTASSNAIQGSGPGSIQSIFKKGRDVQAALNASKVDSLSFDVAVNAMRYGWHVDLSKGIIPLENGLIGLALNKESKVNLQLWEQHLGNKAGAVAKIKGKEPWAMPIVSSGAAKGGDSPLAITPLAFNELKNIFEMSNIIGKNINHLNEAQGFSAINLRAAHIPPANMTNKNVVYLADDLSKIKRQILGNTPKQAQLLADKEIAAVVGGKGERLHKVSEAEIASDFRLRDQIFENPVNFSNPSLQTGVAKGKRGLEVIPVGRGVMDDLLDTLEDQMLGIVRRTHAVIFESELQYAKRQAEIFRGAANKQSRGARANAKFEATDSIFDVYINTVLQRGTLSRDTTLGNVYYGIEDGYDRALLAIFDKQAEILTPAIKNRAALGSEKKELADFNARFGDFTPFKDINAYMENTVNIPRPANLKKHATFLNAFVTAAVLRVFNLGMMMVNVTSTVATLPSVAAAMKPTAREIAAGEAGKRMWQSRVGAFGLPINFEMGLVQFDPLRMSATGMTAFWSKEHAAAMTRAAEMGLLKQDVAERMKIFIAPRQNYVENLIRNQVDMASIATDKSELWSRSVSFATFYDFARKQLGLKMDDAILFANKQADQTIGDFRPVNKPQIFQGATGAPLGLFTTWIWNFMQRVYGDVERRHFTPAVWQYIMQHSLYGAGSLPGFDTFVDAATTNYDGTDSIVDRFNAVAPPGFTDYFMSGTLGNLPKLFGLQDGIAIQSKGDITVPALFTSIVPGSGKSFTDAIPAFSVVSDLMDLTKTAVSDIALSGKVELGALRENLSVNGVNGALRGGMQVWQGYAVDRKRQMINEDTRRLPDTLARIFNLKTNQETARVKFLFQFRQQQARKRELINTLSAHTRTGIRSGVYQGAGGDAQIERDFANYEKAGGSPALVGQWLRKQAIQAQTDKLTSNYLKMIRNNRSEGGAVRLNELVDESD